MTRNKETAPPTSSELGEQLKKCEETDCYWRSLRVTRDTCPVRDIVQKIKVRATNDADGMLHPGRRADNVVLGERRVINGSYDGPGLNYCNFGPDDRDEARRAAYPIVNEHEVIGIDRVWEDAKRASGSTQATAIYYAACRGLVQYLPVMPVGAETSIVTRSRQESFIDKLLRATLRGSFGPSIESCKIGLQLTKPGSVDSVDAIRSVLETVPECRVKSDVAYKILKEQEEAAATKKAEVNEKLSEFSL